jgi:hypothetical protein
MGSDNFLLKTTKKYECALRTNWLGPIKPDRAEKCPEKIGATEQGKSSISSE